jgi:hypothetical protein
MYVYNKYYIYLDKISIYTSLYNMNNHIYIYLYHIIYIFIIIYIIYSYIVWVDQVK